MNRKSKVAAIFAIAVTLVVLFASFYQITRPEQDTLYQVSSFSAFSAGGFEGNTTFGELETHGDFGIGTVNNLDGEMIALNGRFYQIPVSGIPKEIDPSMKTPYATVKFFGTDKTFAIANVSAYSELMSQIMPKLTNDNAIYAIKVFGYFDLVKARSVPSQIKPYPPLADAVKNQTIFNLSGVYGTAIGFYFPDSMNGVDAVGFHLHFLTDDHSAGGHLLDLEASTATVEIDQTNDYRLFIP